MTSVGPISRAVKKLDIQVCGYETVTTPNGNEITEEREVKEGRFTIDMDGEFKSSDAINCPISSIGLFEDAEGKTKYEDPILSVDDNILTINPRTAGNLEFHIVA